MTLGTDYILNALADEGLSHLFMVPGGLVDPFLPALARQTRLKPVVAAHEGGAVYMADGYARASGTFGAALGIGGPGCCNMATAVAAAKTDASPVHGHDRRSAGRDGGAGRVPGRQPGDARRYVRDGAADAAVQDGRRQQESQSLVPPRPGDDVDAAPRPGPPLADARCADRRMRRAGHARSAASSPALGPSAAIRRWPRSIFWRTGRAAKIAILAGAGVEHDAAAARLKEIAERWSIPVATTLRAKGVFPEDHELSLGVFGYAGTRHATNAILDGDLDCLLVLGSGFNERDTMHWTVRERSKALMIHVNTDMDELTAHGDLGHVVPGSCHAFLDLMLERADLIGPALQAGVQPRRDWLTRIKSGPQLYDVENTSRPASPIHPATAIAALRKVFPRDGIVLVDSGAHRAFAGHYWRAYEPRTYISATNLGPMGWAIPAAIGVQCARPDRRVAVITGDGCMQMHGIEVQTAARYGLPVIFLVLNNGALGNVWLRARQYGASAGRTDQHSGSRLGGLRPLARGAGLHGARSGRTRGHLSPGAGGRHRGGDRRQGRQGLRDAGLRFQCRRARLVLSRVRAR